MRKPRCLQRRKAQTRQKEATLSQTSPPTADHQLQILAMQQTQSSLPTQTPAVTAKAAASARPMHAMPVAPVAQRSLLGKTSCSGGMRKDAIAAVKSGRSSVNKHCCDELEDSVAELQTIATTRALDPNHAAANVSAQFCPQSRAVYVPLASGRFTGATVENNSQSWAGPDEKCLLRTSKHPKASIEGGSAMGEWKALVTNLRKQQRMGPNGAVDQIRVGRAGRGKRIPVPAQRRTSGRIEVLGSIPANAADPKPALAYPGAFENKPFDQRCECCRLATTSHISRDFSPLPKPKPGDWLSCQEEKGQSVKAFMSRTRAMNARPGPARMTLYVQPLGSIDLDQISAAKNLEERRRQILQLESQKGLQNLELMLPGSRFLQLLESFLRAFYLGMKVKILPYKQIDLKTVGSRGGKDDAANEWQLNAGDILYRALPRLSGQARAHDGYAHPTFTR